MSDPGIFMIADGKTLVLKRQLYESEDLLQALLASSPEVLAGSTTSDGSRDLLLVAREMGVPSSDSGPNTWSLDHLFVDSEAVPVIVEVKRSTDTRIRREVVGQMLDYAANGVVYWPVAGLRESFEHCAAEAGSSGEERLQELAPGATLMSSGSTLSPTCAAVVFGWSSWPTPFPTNSFGSSSS